MSLGGFIFAVAEVDIGIKQAEANPNVEGNYELLSNFINGLWGYFNLKPVTVTGCFSGNVEQAFEVLSAYYYLAQNAADGNQASTPVYEFFLQTEDSNFRFDWACMSRTKDFQNLQNAIGITN